MLIDILTLFPDMVVGALDHSIIKRARERGIVTIRVVNIRDFTTDRHHTTDDIPYGGGGGMILKIEPISRALASLQTAPDIDLDTNLKRGSTPDSEIEFDSDSVISGESVDQPTQILANGVNYTAQASVLVAPLSALSGTDDPPVGSRGRPRIVLTDPRGPRFTQTVARQWAQEEHIILLCGHYEGVDERVRQHLVTDEISLGDYILTGGELPALIIVDALTRLQPDALGDEQAPDKDTFEDNLLEYPHYTRPREFAGWSVPDILLCGHHAQIERWRRWHQLRATLERRPDLFEIVRTNLSASDLKLLAGEEPTAPPNPKAAARNRPTPGTEGGEHASPEEPRPATRGESDLPTPVQDASMAAAPRLPATTEPVETVAPCVSSESDETDELAI